MSKTKSGKLRCGVIGLGMAQVHVEGFMSHPACELVAVADVDPDESVRTAAAQQLGT